MNNFRRFVVFVLVLTLFFPVTTKAIAPGDIVDIFDVPFGGKIILKSWLVCLIPVPPPIFFIPIPFLFIRVGSPRGADLYYWFGFSKKYRRDSLDLDSWVLGIYMPGADKLTDVCANRDFLPNPDGVIRKVGTSCPGEQYDECEKAKQ